MRPKPSLLNILYSRRTIRRFRKKEITEDVLRLIIEAGQRAPCYYQAYSVVWVKDEAKLKELGELCDSGLVTQASAVLVICLDLHRLRLVLDKLGHDHFMREDKYPAESFFAIFETALLAENMCIAAEVLGYGSAMLDCVLFEFEGVAQLLQLPPGVIPAVVLCMGEKDENPPPRPRWPTDSVLHRDTYRDLDVSEVDRYLDLAEKLLGAEGYLRKYANWNDSYREYLKARTSTTKDTKRHAEELSRLLKQNGLRL